MLPGLRTLTAAVFVTAIVATWVAAGLMRAPAESLPRSAAFPHFNKPLEQPQVAPERSAKPKEQSRLPGYQGEPPSSAPPTRTDGETSTVAKTQKQAPNVADSQSSDAVVTGSLNSPSTGTPTAAYDDVSSAQNQHACAICSGDEQRNRMIRLRGLRPAGARPHARPRILGRRIRALDRGSFI